MKTLKFLSIIIMLSHQSVIGICKNTVPQPEVVALPKFTPKKNIDIEKVMNYQMPDIIDRYRKDYKVSAKKAAQHEIELKRFLIIAAEDYPVPTDMFSTEVDNLWHTFLLFTHEYQNFCQEMFGQFQHHCPTINHKITA